MATTEAQASPRLIIFVLPSIPASVAVARRRVRAVLGSRGLGEYADDAEIIISELLANAVQHACDNDTRTIGVTLTHAASTAALTVAVSDPSPDGPIRRGTPPSREQGRGLQIVAALCAHWDWRREGGGKAVFAVLAREA